MKTLTSLTAAIIFALLLNISSVSAGNHEKKGHKLFNLELNDMQKKDVEIMDFTKGGKYTVIVFFADYCAPCNTELDSINKTFIGWKNNYNTNFVAVCVSNDQNINRIKEKAASHSWSFNMLLDSRNEAMNMMHIAHIPYTVVVDENGYVVYQHDGYSADNIANIQNIISNGVSTQNLAVK